MSTFCIAEAGSCHGGSFEQALALIQVAKEAGADACKFQYWSSADRLAERRHALDYRDVYEQYALPAMWLPKLWNACDQAGLEFMCTVYLSEDIEVISPWVRRFKIASFEAGDAEFIRDHLRHQDIYERDVLVSLGMNAEVRVHSPRMRFLHCVSAYPTPLIDANLAVLHRSGISGFSDHTRCIYTGGFAVAAGARYLETHIRDWTTSRDNPDYDTALDPGQYKEYMRLVRLAEIMMGDGVRRQMPSEAAMAAYKVTA